MAHPHGTDELYALGLKEFRFLSAFLSAHTGIVLPDSKREMVRGRMVKRLRALGLDDFKDYCALLDADPDAELEHVVNAITTNITQFFREPHHFTLLAADLKRLAARPGGPGRLRLWSAGCSTGEEPYSMAMTLMDSLSPAQRRDALILATDIDTSVLERAARGRYPAKAAERLPAGYRRRFIGAEDEDGRIEIAEEVRAAIRFRRLNLLDSWPMKGLFDVIFCRNVAIYFDKPTQRALVDRYANSLKPGGLLFLGHAESLIGVSERFDVVGKTAYRRLP
ncbi:chemotaxis protein methyltransferase [mine drainage metagenome]|uniref:protein-glutamate O-methyltransferase n=1 Tax=mine drainage metagenome TaxID=410659 RepID=A0A1J5RWN6_9ZZZZ